MGKIAAAELASCAGAMHHPPAELIDGNGGGLGVRLKKRRQKKA